MASLLQRIEILEKKVDWLYEFLAKSKERELKFWLDRKFKEYVDNSLGEKKSVSK